jgi:hypothetical protein
MSVSTRIATTSTATTTTTYTAATTTTTSTRTATATATNTVLVVILPKIIVKFFRTEEIENKWPIVETSVYDGPQLVGDEDSKDI